LINNNLRNLTDTSIISNIGQYLSVDSRPVSCTRGALKKITSIYKSQLRSASVTSADAKITDPFLYMNIICPRGSYDANVEPAKDDVLFTDADCIVSLVGKFFGSVYGELKSGPTHAAGPEAPPKTSGIALMLARKHSPSRLKSLVPRPPLDRSSWDPQSHSRSTFKLQQPSDTPVPEIFPHEARTSTPSKAELKVCAKGKAAVAAVNDPGKRFNGHPFATKSAQDDVDSRAVSNEKVSTWRESMYDEDEDDDVDEFPDSPARPTPSETLEEEANLRSIQVSNPWAFAKLNAPVCAHGSQRHHAVEADGNNQLPTPRRQAGDAGEFSEPFSDEGHHASLSASGLPTPRRSQPQDLLQPASSPLASFPFPLRARGKGKADVTTKDLSPSNRESNGRGALDAWVQRSSISHQKEYELPDEDQLSGNLMSPPNVPIAGPFVSARTLPRGTPLSDIPDISERPRRKAVPRRQQQQFSSDHSQFAPVNDLEKVWFDTGDKPKRKQSHQVRQRQRHPEPPILRDDEDDVPIVSPPAKTQDPPIHPDLAITLDYEARKHLATQQHRESLRRQTAKTLAQNSTIPTTSPHKNRQQAAIAALHTSADPPPLSSDPSHFSTNDPRAHLIRTAHLSETEHQKAPTHGKFKRTKTSLLPFETIKSTNYTGNLIQPIDTKRLNFTALLNSSADDFIRTGIISSAFSTQTAVQIKAWEETLKEMVKTQYRIEGMAAEEEMEGQLECDLAGILSQHDAMEG